MPKETKKKAAPKKAPAKAAKPEKEPKKNPLLDAEEDTDLDTEEEETDEEETDEETSDEEDSEDDDASEDSEEDEEEAPKKAPAKASKTGKKEAAPVHGNADAALNSDIATTKAKIDKEPKVQFLIPRRDGEKKGATHEVFINGAKFVVKKGVMTMVPQSVAALLAEHYQITSEAGEDFRLDMDDSKADALA